MDIAKTITLYNLDDVTFTLSDDRASKLLDDFGKVVYSAENIETIQALEEYATKRSNSSHDIVYDIARKYDSASSQYHNVFSLLPYEKFYATDKQETAYYSNLKEALAIQETYWDNVLFLLHVAECIRTVDKAIKNESKQTNDAFYVTDSLHKKAGLNKLESASITDGFHRVLTILRILREELKILDKTYRNIYSVRDDHIAIADKQLASPQKEFKESVNTADEVFDRNMTFIRGFSELARIGDGLTRDIGKNPAEDIALYDAFVRASNGYIESVQVLSSFKEMNDFTAMSDTPPLYEQFTDFNVGDYEYEKALLRLRVVSKATQAQPLLYDVSPHVDIDDTDDKGQLEIKDTTAATKVYYNKHYYNAPEVNAMVKGGTGTTTPVPNILTTDGQDDKGRYFEIELLNSSGNRTTGIVSWVAKGW